MSNMCSDNNAVVCTKQKSYVHNKKPKTSMNRNILKVVFLAVGYASLIFLLFFHVCNFKQNDQVLLLYCISYILLCDIKMNFTGFISHIK